MKNKFIIAFGLIFTALVIFVACDTEDFLDKPAQGQLDPTTLSSTDGLELVLIGAYAELDGFAGVGSAWESSGSNWVYGEVMADNAYKGSDAGDQSNVTFFERYTVAPTNPYISTKWRAVYDGVSRSNDVLRIAATEEAQNLGEAFLTQVRAEARFLRGWYHFEAITLWDNVPYVDETVLNGMVPNAGMPWAEIEADFQFAIDNLPDQPRNGQVGRATKQAAQAMLAKSKLHQGDYSSALNMLNAVINSGKYQLMTLYHDNFKAETNNNEESVFEIQASINDGAGGGENGLFGNILNFPYTGGPGACCGFFQPSQNLVNAFQTENGLPLLNTFNNTNVTSDQGLLSSDPFTEHTGPLDPRLDWTVGRRGVPYLDWGNHPGQNWIRDQGFGGPYSPKKNTYYASEEGSNSNAGGWGGGTVANNHRSIRYADILLMAAECLVEQNNLDQALTYVNMIRSRAANPDGFVMDPDGTPAANYVINTWPAFNSQDHARQVVRFERRLELAMEGHRFYDLKRWGVAQQVINEYLAVEATKRQYLQGASFQAHNIRLPIPQTAIDQSEGTLTQNTGY